MYGNGSDGPLVVTGTTNLALDTKHQFTTVDIQTGATLQGIGNGAVLYICATESITIAGTIQAHSITPGDNKTTTFTVDGVTYTAPGVAPGGKGGDNLHGATGGPQGSGFGGGGAGGGISIIENYGGGRGGTGGVPGGTGGASRSFNDSRGNGNNGGTSSGGGGAGLSLAGTVNTGKGGDAYNNNGLNATGSNGDQHAGGGGGGAGGRSGAPGVHIVLCSPIVNVSGTVETIGVSMFSDGSNGGNGGSRFANNAAWAANGSGGGGGGGGNAGNIYITGTELDYYSATLNLFGGTGGPGGSGYQAGENGASGTDGQFIARRIPIPRTHHLIKYYNGTNWVIGRAKGSAQSQWEESVVEATII